MGIPRTGSPKRAGTPSRFPVNSLDLKISDAQVGDSEKVSVNQERVSSEPIFWEGDATKHFSVKKKGFSVKRGEAIQ